MSESLHEILAQARAELEQARTSIVEAEAEGIDVTDFRVEHANIERQLADLAAQVEATS